MISLATKIKRHLLRRFETRICTTSETTLTCVTFCMTLGCAGKTGDGRPDAADSASETGDLPNEDPMTVYSEDDRYAFAAIESSTTSWCSIRVDGVVDCNLYLSEYFEWDISDPDDFPLAGVSISPDHACATNSSTQQSYCWGCDGFACTEEIPAGSTSPLAVGSVSCYVDPLSTVRCTHSNVGSAEADQQVVRAWGEKGKPTAIDSGDFSLCSSWPGLTDCIFASSALLQDLPTTASFDSLVIIDSGGCGLSATGRATCWSGAPTDLPDEEFLTLDLLRTGHRTACYILLSDGSIGCVGASPLAKLTPPSGSFVDVAVRSDGVGMAVREDGVLVTWQTDCEACPDCDGCGEWDGGTVD